MKNWKIPAGCAVFALIIAVFAGWIGGVSFGILILRGIISGVVFGAVIYGLLLVMKTRLPDLYAIFSPSEEHQEEQEGVDIVISDDTEVGASPPEPAPAGVETFAEEVNEVTGGGVVETAEPADEGALGELQSAEEQGEEPQELGDIDGGFDKFGKAEELSDISGKEAEVVEVLGEFQDPQEVARAVQTMMNRDEE